MNRAKVNVAPIRAGDTVTIYDHFQGAEYTGIVADEDGVLWVRTDKPRKTGWRLSTFKVVGHKPGAGS